MDWAIIWILRFAVSINKFGTKIGGAPSVNPQTLRGWVPKGC